MAGAVEQLDAALNEPGDDPPKWELLQLSARALREVNPADAAARYLRSFQYGAPDSIAREACQWVGSLPLGVLRLNPGATDDLIEQPTTACRQLLAAGLLRSLGDSKRARAVIDQVAAPTDMIRGTLAALDVRCSMDLGEYERAERGLAALTGESVLAGTAVTTLRARLAFMRRDFEGALGYLDRFDGPADDEFAALRNLAYVGAGRGGEVRWPDPGGDDTAGPETWLSRAVAALALSHYADAELAASWAEQGLTETISVLLVKAQAHLENGDLEQGLAILELVAKDARERGRDPLWLARQQVVRTGGRFAYVECEYLNLNGSLTVERIRAVSKSETTYAQNGRLCELEAGLHGCGLQWAAALDNGVSAYRAADRYAEALRLAEQVFQAAPSPARARAFGWAAHNGSFPAGSEMTAAAAVPARAERLAAAISAVEATMEQITDRELPESLQLLTALKLSRVKLLERDAIKAGTEATAWAFASAIVAADDARQQLVLEWLVRFAFNNAAASFDIAGYAQTLDPALPAVIETQLRARTNLFGVDRETYELLSAFRRQPRAGPAGATEASERWSHAVKLRLAVLEGDLVQASELIDADVGDYPWALQLRALAAIQLNGLEAAKPVIADALDVLSRAGASKLYRVPLVLMAGDLDQVDALVTAAREEGNNTAAEIDNDALTLQYVRYRDSSVLDFASDLIGRAQCPAELCWLERVTLPVLGVLGIPIAEQQSQITARIAHRRAEIPSEHGLWVEKLAQTDPAVGALANLWRTVTSHNPQRLAAALDRVESLEAPAPLCLVLDGVIRGARAKLARDSLTRAVAAVGTGREPGHDPAASQWALMTTPIATLAGALAGEGQLDDPPSDQELAAGAACFADAISRPSVDAAAIWRLYEAVETLPGKFASAWQPGLRDGLLNTLGSLVGLDARSAYGYRSHLSFILGDAFIPADTSEHWVLFSEYIPRLSDRIMAVTGYRIPGFNVRGNQYGTPGNVVHLLLHDVIFESYELPSDGVLLRFRRDGVPAHPPQATFRDPLSEDLVWHWTQAGPPAGAVEQWLPLEFVMRYVERFVRRHLANIVTVRDVIRLADQSGPEVASQFSDPAVLQRWLSEMRRAVAAGAAREAVSWAQAIAERVARPGADGQSAGGATARRSADDRRQP